MTCADLAGSAFEAPGVGFSTGSVSAPKQNLVLAVPSTVALGNIGAASASVTCFRSLGGAVGVSVLGAVLAHQVTASITGSLAATGAPSAGVSAADPVLRGGARHGRHQPGATSRVLSAGGQIGGTNGRAYWHPGDRGRLEQVGGHRGGAPLHHERGKFDHGPAG